MSWPPIPHHFDYDDEFLDDTPPDDSDDVVYVSKVTGLPIGQETRTEDNPPTETVENTSSGHRAGPRPGEAWLVDYSDGQTVALLRKTDSTDDEPLWFTDEGAGYTLDWANPVARMVPEHPIKTVTAAEDMEDTDDHPDQPPSPGGAGMTTPQIITTIEQLEALDPDSVLLDHGGDTDPVSGWLSIRNRVDIRTYLPAVVIATGDQVRDAREALEQL